MKRSKKDSTQLRKRAWTLKSKGTSNKDIAKVLGVSVRMVYRYLESYELDMARMRLDRMRLAYQKLPPEAKKAFDDALKEVNQT